MVIRLRLFLIIEPIPGLQKLDDIHDPPHPFLEIINQLVDVQEAVTI